MLPFLSLLGLLLCHCHVELLQSGGECLPFSSTADLGQALQGKNRGIISLPGNHLPGATSYRTPCHDGAEKGPCIRLPTGIHLLHPKDHSMACGASSGTEQAVAAPQPCTHEHMRVHTCAYPLRPLGCLPIPRLTAEACESFIKHPR